MKSLSGLVLLVCFMAMADEPKTEPKPEKEEVLSLTDVIANEGVRSYNWTQFNKKGGGYTNAVLAEKLFNARNDERKAIEGKKAEGVLEVVKVKVFEPSEGRPKRVELQAKLNKPPMPKQKGVKASVHPMYQVKVTVFVEDTKNTQLEEIHTGSLVKVKGTISHLSEYSVGMKEAKIWTKLESMK